MKKQLLYSYSDSTEFDPSTSVKFKQGEIAIDYHKGDEVIYLKNDNAEIVTFENSNSVNGKINAVSNAVNGKQDKLFSIYEEKVVSLSSSTYYDDYITGKSIHIGTIPAVPGLVKTENIILKADTMVDLMLGSNTPGSAQDEIMMTVGSGVIIKSSNTVGISVGTSQDAGNNGNIIIEKTRTQLYDECYISTTNGFEIQNVGTIVTRENGYFLDKSGVNVILNENGAPTESLIGVRSHVGTSTTLVDAIGRVKNGYNVEEDFTIGISTIVADMFVPAGTLTSYSGHKKGHINFGSTPYLMSLGYDGEAVTTFTSVENMSANVGTVVKPDGKTYSIDISIAKDVKNGIVRTTGTNLDRRYDECVITAPPSKYISIGNATDTVEIAGTVIAPDLSRFNLGLVSATANTVELKNTSNTTLVTLPSATQSAAGVMSAQDKTNLDYLYNADYSYTVDFQEFATFANDINMRGYAITISDISTVNVTNLWLTINGVRQTVDLTLTSQAISIPISAKMVWEIGRTTEATSAAIGITYHRTQSA